MNNRNSRFQRGSAVFNCSACSRSTRHTGVQSVDSELCPQCYDLAGIYNVYQDNGVDGLKPYHADIVRLCGEITAKGGILDSDSQFLLSAANGTVSLEIAGKTIQHDPSGHGHAWRPANDDNCPADIQEQIAGEIINGERESCPLFEARNGQVYRW
jgi:hypothetical protein